MLIQIDVNGKTVKAIFDTGCAADGIVYHPSEFKNLGLQVKNPFPQEGVSQGPDRIIAEKIVIGPITKMQVRAYPAAGLSYPLIGPKMFDRPYTVDQKDQLIRFDY